MQLSAEVSAIKGKVNGSIFQGYKGQQVVRTRKSFNKQRQGAMQTQIASQTSLAGTWKQLSDIQRLSWSSASPSFPRYDKFGNPTTLSGYGLYLSLNGVLKYMGETLLTGGPTPETLDSIMSVEFNAITTSSFDIKSVTSASFNCYAVLSVSRPYPSSVSPSRIQFVKINKSVGTGTTYTDIITNYEARFGKAVVGSKIYVKIETFCFKTGQLSLGLTASGIVA